MANEQYLIEVTQDQKIRAGELKADGRYEAQQYRGRPTYALSDATLEDYAAYWREWIAQSGYIKEDEADICFLYPKPFDIEAFLAAARAEGVGITFSPATRWGRQGIETYLRHTDRHLESISSAPGGAIALVLASGDALFAKSGEGRRFAATSSKRKKTSAPKRRKKEAPPKEKTGAAKAHISRATREEIAQGIRLLAEEKCRTVDENG